jgi:hypothetical protein
MPENLHYGGEVATANVVYLLVTLLAGVMMLILRRDKAGFVYVFTGLLIPLGQAVNIATLHFHMLRILVLFGLIRILMDRASETNKSAKLHSIDKAFIGLSVVSFVATNLLFRNSPAFIFAAGVLYTALGCYFVARHFIQDEQQVLSICKALVMVGALASAVMVIEQVAHVNLFGFLGGVPLHPAVREERYRSQAMFAHSIIAGCYGATLFPLGIYLWAKEKSLKLYALAALLCSVVMVVTSASSTPVMAFLGALVAFGFWPLRKQMPWVRRALVLILVMLHMIMKAPVWQLIARIDVIGGNSADHRYQLVNQTIVHFSEWWLYGTANNNDWGWDMWDTANLFVGTAISAGLFGLILLIMLFSRSFRAIGTARAAWDGDRKKEFEFWAFGSLIFTQLMVFVGVSYFDQATLVWYVFLCMVVVLTKPATQLATSEHAELDRSRGFKVRALRTPAIPELVNSGRRQFFKSR